MDAGGLAQMTYNNLSNNGGLGLPSSGFASRGKAAHIKRLSVAPAVGSIDENEADGNHAPRTSRSHLLAGLRTAPRINTQNIPASAPYSQTSFGGYSHAGQDVPQSATASNFGNIGQSQYTANNRQMYSPEQVLAPPSLNLHGDDGNQMDPQTYNLMLTKMYLAQRQQQLQQQLINVQAAAQQFQGMNINGQQQYSGSPMSPQGGYYNQQLQNGMQPVIQPVPNQPGLYSVYNPMTGQMSYMPDPSLQQQHMPQSPPASGPNSSPESDGHSFVRRDTKSPPNAAAAGWARTFSPPRQTPSPPQDVTPLPEPSANAFRPGHRKSVSSVNKPAPTPRASAFPQTPINGTFGLGLGRAGEHPIRQPRGPPALDELTAAPTSKHEGSKNFATRQRRKALFSLVRAGNERRGGRPSSANGDVPTPGSEKDAPFSGSSDAGSEGTPATGTLSAHSSTGSLKAAAGGAIGSEVKHLKEQSRERDTFARRLTDSGFSSDDGKDSDSSSSGRRKTPMLVLTSAEKRKMSPGPN